MKMNTSKSELTISPENSGDVLELTDADLVQIQGGGGSGCNDSGNWESNGGCNNGRFHYQRHDRDAHSRHHSWGSSNVCNGGNDYNVCNGSNGYNVYNGSDGSDGSNGCHGSNSCGRH